MARKSSVPGWGCAPAPGHGFPAPATGNSGLPIHPKRSRCEELVTITSLSHRVFSWFPWATGPKLSATACSMECRMRRVSSGLSRASVTELTPVAIPRPSARILILRFIQQYPELTICPCRSRLAGAPDQNCAPHAEANMRQQNFIPRVTLVCGGVPDLGNKGLALPVSGMRDRHGGAGVSRIWVCSRGGGR